MVGRNSSEEFTSKQRKQIRKWYMSLNSQSSIPLTHFLQQSHTSQTVPTTGDQVSKCLRLWGRGGDLIQTTMCTYPVLREQAARQQDCHQHPACAPESLPLGVCLWYPPLTSSRLFCSLWLKLAQSPDQLPQILTRCPYYRAGVFADLISSLSHGLSGRSVCSTCHHTWNNVGEWMKGSGLDIEYAGPMVFLPAK